MNTRGERCRTCNGVDPNCPDCSGIGESRLPDPKPTHLYVSSDSEDLARLWCSDFEVNLSHSPDELRQLRQAERRAGHPGHWMRSTNPKRTTEL